MPTSNICNVFLRLNNRRKRIDASVFKAANYPMAIPDRGQWQEIHKWCREVFKDAKGRQTYSWTGEKFWFLTEQDKMAFVFQWGDQTNLPKEQRHMF